MGLIGSGLVERVGSLWRDTAAADVEVALRATMFMSTSFKPAELEVVVVVGCGSLVGEDGALWVSV